MAARRYDAALKGVLSAPIAVGSLSSSSGIARAAPSYDEVTILVLYPFLGDRSYLRGYDASIATGRDHPGAKITVKAGLSRWNVEFFLEEIGSAAANGFDVLAINTGGVSKPLVNAVSRAEKDGVTTVSFDGSPPESPAVVSVIDCDATGAAARIDVEAGGLDGSVPAYLGRLEVAEPSRKTMPLTRWATRDEAALPSCSRFGMGPP